MYKLIFINVQLNYSDQITIKYNNEWFILFLKIQRSLKKTVIQ